MEVIRFFAVGILSFGLLIVYLIIDVFCLWILRVALNWWLDIDYVEKINKLIAKWREEK